MNIIKNIFSSKSCWILQEPCTLRALRDFDRIESRTSGWSSKNSVKFSWTDCSTILRTSGFPNLVCEIKKEIELTSHPEENIQRNGKPSDKIWRIMSPKTSYHLCLTFKFWIRDLHWNDTCHSFSYMLPTQGNILILQKRTIDIVYYYFYLVG
jgi:hypothetical protein